MARTGPAGYDIAIVTTDLEATASPTKHGYGSEDVHVARVVWMANWQPEVDGLPALAVAEIERMDDGRGRAARVLLRGPSVPGPFKPVTTPKTPVEAK